MATESHRLRLPLDEGWQMLETGPDAVAGSPGLPPDGWLPALVPGTVAGALAAAGRSWRRDGAGLEGSDFWFRRAVAVAPPEQGEELALQLQGLATLAEVWVDGELRLRSDSMFVSHELPLPAGASEVTICFRALGPRLEQRRPRPRWRVPMAEHQQLRWFRTTLLGRTPGWSAPAPPIGPWRPIVLERRRRVVIEDVRLRSRVDGEGGVVEVVVVARVLDGSMDGARVVVAGPGGGAGSTLTVETLEAGRFRLAGQTRVPSVALWWPHTHGAQPLYEVTLELAAATVVLGRTGFRTLTVDTRDGDFAVRVNGVPVFCRGACFNPLDPIRLVATKDAYARAIEAVRAAGMNMLRVSGTMIYEDDAFHDLCDERGVLLWQDLMFANLDYPEGDEAFVRLALTEVRQALARWQGRPSLAIVCGDSEGEQQMAMWGTARAAWRRPLFVDRFAALVHESLPEVTYVPSSATGGAFPHQPNTGPSSYYGVGAYQRPLEDARRSEVRFASECLAFANVPEESTVVAMPGGASLRTHHPGWKAGVPRDLGAGWDFEDVRDHYLRLIFGVDPIALRYEDHARYLALSRVVTGEVMAATFAEWRRLRSSCRGGLIWFLRDLVPGAGWGIIDVCGTPKAAYHYLRRTLQPLALVFSDEGLNGLYLHAINEGRDSIDAELRVTLYRGRQVAGAGGARAVVVPGRGGLELPVAALLEGFSDTNHAYRFGPRAYDLAVATLVAGGGTAAEAFHLPLPLPAGSDGDIGLSAQICPLGDGSYDIVVRARRFAFAVTIEAPHHAANDAYFHLAPGGERVIRLTATRAGAPLRGRVVALNSDVSAAIEVR